MTNYLEIKNKFKSYNLPDGTYVLHSVGTPVELEGGYQVSFERPDDTYTEHEFNLLCTGFEFIGYRAFMGVWGGVPEISFHVTDKAKALEMANKFNQDAIYDWKNAEVIQMWPY